MKERLYNEFGAALGEHVSRLDEIVLKAVEQAVEYAHNKNIDLRDVQNNFIMATVNDFSYHILLNATNMRKARDKNHLL